MNQNQFMVSILCTAYNHERYIAQALEGFLCQETTFPVEILVNDDASTDNTASIIREFCDRYPGKLTPIYQTENQYSKGISSMQLLIDRAKGKYLALCEGDDYWTDPHKLEIQVSILEQHPEYAASVHNEVVVMEDGTPWPENYQKIYREQKDCVHDAEMLCNYIKFSHTASVVMRSDIFSNMSEDTREAYLKVKANGDMKWAALIAARGLVYHFARDMACYRYVPMGNDSWSSKNNGKNISMSTYRQLEAIRDFMRKHYGFLPSYQGYLKNLNYQTIRTAIKKPTRENIAIMLELKRKSGYRFADFLADGIQRVGRKLST